MNDRQIQNLRKMAATWSIKVTEAKSDLDQRVARKGEPLSQLRARFRQYGLCLVATHEQVEYLTGCSNAERDHAFEQYSSALRALGTLRSEEDGFVETTSPNSDLSARRSNGDPRFEDAERAADAALLLWCTA